MEFAYGITQLAERLAVSQTVISSYARGELVLNGELTVTLAGIPRISTEEFLCVRIAKSRSAAPRASVVDEGLARHFALLGALPRRDRGCCTSDAFVAAPDAGAKGRQP